MRTTILIGLALALGGCSGGSGNGDGGDSSTYCGIIKLTRHVCEGEQNESYSDQCVDDVEDCYEVLPEDTKVGPDDCYTRTIYSVFADGPQEGTCDDYFAYWAGEIECLLDKHCGDNATCIEHICVCNSGADCSAVGPNDGGQDGGQDGGVVADDGPTDGGSGPECVVAEDCPELDPPGPGMCYIRHCNDGVCEPEEASGADCG